MLPPMANPHTPGRERRPRRSAQQPPSPMHHVRRIRIIYVVGRADPARRAATPQFSAILGESASVSPVGKGLAPSGGKCPDVRQTRANSQACSAFARVFPCRPVCCAERASPFPTMGRLRIRRTWHLFLCCCRGVGTPPPTMGCCGFAGRGYLALVLLRGAPGRRALQGAEAFFDLSA